MGRGRRRYRPRLHGCHARGRTTAAECRMSRSQSVVVQQEWVGHEHLAAASRAIDAFVTELPTLERWGRRLAITLLGGGRVLVVGNGGSAAQAQHLTSELV